MLRLFASNLFSFQKPSFHASFAWSLGDVSENISPSTLAKIQVENSNNFPKLQKRIMSNPIHYCLCAVAAFCIAVAVSFRANCDLGPVRMHFRVV